MPDSPDTKYDEFKGRAKKAAGSLADDEELENEGRVDQVVADVKDKVNRAADKVKDVVGRSDGDGNDA